MEEEDYTGSKIECYGFDEGRSYIGDALLLNRVASGGLGQVYLAQFKTGSSAGSFSALKIVTTGQTMTLSRVDQLLECLFTREITTLIRLQGHLSVVGMQGIGSTNKYGYERFCMFLDWMPGGDVRAFIDTLDAPLGEAAAGSIMLPVLRALAAAHSLGVIHRDVKASNILLGMQGEVKLADWGISGEANSLPFDPLQPATPALQCVDHDPMRQQHESHPDTYGVAKYLVGGALDDIPEAPASEFGRGTADLGSHFQSHRVNAYTALSCTLGQSHTGLSTGAPVCREDLQAWQGTGIASECCNSQSDGKFREEDEHTGCCFPGLLRGFSSAEGKRKETKARGSGSYPSLSSSPAGAQSSIARDPASRSVAAGPSCTAQNIGCGLQFVAEGTGLQFVTEGTGLQFVTEGTGLQLVTEGTGLQLVTEGTGLQLVTEGTGLQLVTEGTGLQLVTEGRTEGDQFTKSSSPGPAAIPGNTPTPATSPTSAPTPTPGNAITSAPAPAPVPAASLPPPPLSLGPPAPGPVASTPLGPSPPSPASTAVPSPQSPASTVVPSPQSPASTAAPTTAIIPTSTGLGSSAPAESGMDLEDIRATPTDPDNPTQAESRMGMEAIIPTPTDPGSSAQPESRMGMEAIIPTTTDPGSSAQPESGMRMRDMRVTPSPPSSPSSPSSCSEDFATPKQPVDEIRGQAMGTPGWAAPELELGQPHDKSVDVWSFGITFVELVTGSIQTYDMSTEALEKLSLPHAGFVPDGLSPEALSMLQLCLRPQPDSRLSSVLLLQHPFFLKAAIMEQQATLAGLLPVHMSPGKTLKPPMPPSLDRTTMMLDYNQQLDLAARQLAYYYNPPEALFSYADDSNADNAISMGCTTAAMFTSQEMPNDWAYQFQSLDGRSVPVNKPQEPDDPYDADPLKLSDRGNDMKLQRSKTCPNLSLELMRTSLDNLSIIGMGVSRRASHYCPELSSEFR